MIRVLTKKRYEELLITELKYQKLTDKTTDGKYKTTLMECPKCHNRIGGKAVRCPNCNKILKILKD